MARLDVSVLLPVGVGLGLGVIFVALSHSSSIASNAPGPKKVTPPAPPPKKTTPKVQPAPAPKPAPAPQPGPGPQPQQYMYPVGSVVQANVGRLGRREPGVQSVKIIKNRATANAAAEGAVTGDYEVIADDCFFPDSWCASEWINQSDIVD